MKMISLTNSTYGYILLISYDVANPT